MELRHFRYFAAVAQEVHFGRAAKRIRVAQPALTRQIRNLEKELGVALFERLPRGVRLTAAGQSLLSDTQKLLAEIDRMADRARSIDRGDCGTVRIGFSDTAGWEGIMPATFKSFRANYPNVDLQIFQMVSREQLRALREFEIDAGFIYGVPKTELEFETLVVGGCDVVLALPAEHPLAVQAEIALCDLRQESFVWPKAHINPIYHSLLVAACAAGGLQPRVVQEVSDDSFALSLIATGGVVGFVNTTTYARCPKRVVLREVVDLSVPLNLEFTWRNDDKSPALHAFVRTVASLAENRPSEGNLLPAR